MSNLEVALEYLRQGLSVIPVGRGKKPFIKWKEFQDRFPTEDEVRHYWKQFPDAGVGIVTGKISGISVVDFDLYKYQAIQVPDELNNLETPTAKTPRGGKHFYFAYDERIPNTSEIAKEKGKGLDGRNDGGFIIAPPSNNGIGKYEWIIPFSREYLSAPPDGLISLLKNAFNIGGVTSGNSGTQQSATNVTNVTLSFDEGSRDNSLFHVAHSLIKGGMAPVNALKCLEILASQCNPPFPTSEVKAKLDSAIQRAMTKERNLTAEIREWVSATFGNFSATSAYHDVTIVTKEDKAKARVIFSRLVDEGLIERIEGKNGWYRKIDTSLEKIDYLNASTETIDIKMPLGEHELVEIMPGNIILLAGEPNSGKTSWLFNFVKLNMHKFDIRYLNSEMSPEELRKRLENFDDVKITGWKWDIYNCNGDFDKHIKPGKGNINVIDYLEIYSDFWEIGRFINDIHKKLDGAIAVVAIQKNPGTTTGLGGFRTLEKPRLALAISHGRMDIVKAKNWATPDNPNGKYCEFKILKGGHMYSTTLWKRDK